MKSGNDNYLLKIDPLRLVGVVKRWLVLAPKRVCTDVWPVEQPKWAPGLQLAVAVPTRNFATVATHSPGATTTGVSKLMTMASICVMVRLFNQLEVRRLTDSLLMTHQNLTMVLCLLLLVYY